MSAKVVGSGFVHVVGSQVIDIDKLCHVLELLNTDPISIVYSFAMGGCDFAPAPFQIPHFAFARALLSTPLGRSVGNMLRSLSRCIPPPDTDIHVALTAMTYAMCRLPTCGPSLQECGKRPCRRKI